MFVQKNVQLLFLMINISYLSSFIYFYFLQQNIYRVFLFNNKSRILSKEYSIISYKLQAEYYIHRSSKLIKKMISYSYESPSAVFWIRTDMQMRDALIGLLSPFILPDQWLATNWPSKRLGCVWRDTTNYLHGVTFETWRHLSSLNEMKLCAACN